MNTEDELICDEFIIKPFRFDENSSDCVWFGRKDGEGMVMPKEVLKSELEALFMRLM